MYSVQISTRRILESFKVPQYCLNMPFDLDGSPNVSNKSIRTDQEGRSYHAIFLLAIHLLKSPDSIGVQPVLRLDQEEAKRKADGSSGNDSDSFYMAKTCSA